MALLNLCKYLNLWIVGALEVPNPHNLSTVTQLGDHRPGPLRMPKSESNLLNCFSDEFNVNIIEQPDVHLLCIWPPLMISNDVPILINLYSAFL
jgi:hypothetical protein